MGRPEMVLATRRRLTWATTRYAIGALAIIQLLFVNYLFFGSPLGTFSLIRPSSGEHLLPRPILTADEQYELDLSLVEEEEGEVDFSPKINRIEPLPIPRRPIGKYPSSDSALATFNVRDYKFYGEYIGWPLQRVCDEAQWTPGLAFVCDNNSGGVGNIRNFILTCIRYAIESGATQLILPRIQQRSAQNLGQLFTTTQHFDYLFDEGHFRRSMRDYCPQMNIYDTLDDVPNASEALNIQKFFPKDLNAGRDGFDVRGTNRHLDMYRKKFDEWLSTRRRTPSLAEPVTIRMKWPTFFEWPIFRDGPEFAATFGDILRFRKDVQELAIKIIMEMMKFAGAEPDSQTLGAPYLGAHLRTESDALHNWPDFKQQSTGYLDEAEKWGLEYVYLACGDEGEANRFSGLAQNQSTPLRVATKNTLLKGDDLKRLKDLSWDQQALVDFLVLMKSTHFTGCSFSTFTMNIALKRHLMEDGIRTRQWRSPGDEFSTLVGRFDSWFGDWMFMYECMWP